MSYKSLLTVLTDPQQTNSHLNSCIEMAQALDAHLEVLCLGVDVTQTGYTYAGINMLVVQETWGQAHDNAKDLRETVEARLASSGIRWSVDHSAVALMDLGRLVMRHALFADLVILPKPYGEGVGIEREPVVEAAMFQGRAAVLVLPEGAAVPVAPKSVTVCWNESPEALTAVRRALPLLKSAGLVHVLVIDPPVHGPDRSDPGGLLAQMLGRHDVRCEIDVVGKSLPRVSEVINRHATDTSADLVVMGAYGHSRFREAILGGATRHMLEQATVPVLMAH